MESQTRKRAREGEASDVVHVQEVSDVVDEYGRRMVNEYSVVGALGRGSFGEVSLVEHLRTKARFALKQMRRPKRKAALPLGPFAHLGAGGADDCLYREVAVLKRLCHPHIIALRQVLDDGASDSLYLLLQLAQEGPLLPPDAPHARLSEAAARTHFRELLCALSHMHARGVTHGDLKPDHLLLGEGRSLLVADFGLARLWEGGQWEQGPRSGGTPAFCCPERLLGALGGFESLAAADLWAAGGCLHALLSGLPPFRAQSVAQLLDAIVQEEPVVDAAVPAAARALILGLLAKQPARRLTLRQAATHPWVRGGGVSGAAEWELPSEDADLARASAEVSEEEVAAAIEPLDRLVSVVLLTRRLQAAVRLQKVARGRLARRAAMGSLRTVTAAALLLQLFYKAKRADGRGEAGAVLQRARTALFSLFWRCSRRRAGRTVPRKKPPASSR